MKQKCKLFMVSDKWVDDVQSQLKKALKAKSADQLDEFLVLAGMLGLAREHRIPPKATAFKGPDDKAYPFPKEFMEG